MLSAVRSLVLLPAVLAPLAQPETASAQAAGAAAADASTVRSGATARRPNIVFVFSDDHAPHALGAYGGQLAALDPTPNIDRLARQGMLFRNSFCTNSICGPSRAVILTGRHSHINGFKANGYRFDPDQQTFPKLLQAAGYRTALIGKWHLQSDPQGFDHWEVLPGQGRYYNPVLLGPGGKRRVIEGHCTDVVTDLALEWLQRQVEGSADGSGDDRPFLLMCQHKAPHRNWMPALRHLSLYDDVEIPEPATLFDRWEDNASPARWQQMEIDRHMHEVFDLFFDPPDGFRPDEEEGSDKSGFRNIRSMTDAQREAWRTAFAERNAAFAEADLRGKDLVRAKYQRYMKNYLRCVRGVDESVGRLTAFLEENGLAENTVVIYASDQGFFLGDHGWYDKRWMYEESLRMPLIVKWPGVVEPGSARDELVQNLDYAQTLLEMAGVPPDDVPLPEDGRGPMQGRSLVPLLSAGDAEGGGEVPAWRDAIYYHYFGYPAVHMVARHYGIRTDRYKLIRFYEFDEWELYDLVRDPDETTNLYDDPAYRDVVTRLAVDLGGLRARYRDDTDGTPKPLAWRSEHRRER